MAFSEFNRKESKMKNGNCKHEFKFLRFETVDGIEKIVEKCEKCGGIHTMNRNVGLKVPASVMTPDEIFRWGGKK